MDKFCKNCGNEILPNNKFCMKCGANIENSEDNSSLINNEAVKEKFDHLKKTVVDVSSATMEKTRQAVKNSQEFIKSEEFQNAKEETVKRTKSFFRCNINNNDDYLRAEQSKRKCIYVIFLTIALIVFFGPLYSVSWGKGLLKPILFVLGIISHIVRFICVPIILLAIIKFFITHSAIKKYKASNEKSIPIVQHINKKPIVVLLTVCVACSVCFTTLNHVVGISHLVEKSNGSSGLQFKLTVDEYIEKYNKNISKDVMLSKENAKQNSNYEVISYSWDLGEDQRLLSVIAYKDTGKIREVRYVITNSEFNKLMEHNPSAYFRDLSMAWGAINNSLTESKIKSILTGEDSKNTGNTYRNGINYAVSGTKDGYVLSMQAITEENFNNSIKMIN